MGAGRGRRVMAVAIVSFASVVSSVNGGAAAPPNGIAVAGAGCDQGPSRPRDAATDDLDDDVAAWGVFCDGGHVSWEKTATSAPSLDGRALRCGLRAGTQAYAGLHCYRELLAEPDANRFELALAFHIQPDTTCNNAGSPSVVQALELAVSTWRGGRRWELALQWENVNQIAGDGAPQWRYWDGTRPAAERWVPVPGTAGACLTGNAWHSVELRGAVTGGVVRYDDFTVDGVVHPMRVTTGPVDDGTPDRIAVGVQLNANGAASPYDLVVDQVRLRRWADTEVGGFSWYADGSVARAGPAGTVVQLYGTGLRPSTTYHLVTARAVGDDSCAAAPVPVNASVRLSNRSGFIGLTGGSVDRPPGVYDVCFYELGTGLEPRRVGSPVRFTVVG